MIRFATSADIPQIRELWVEAFGDSLEYIDAFIASIGSPSRCLVFVTNGQIVSMTYLLPCHLLLSDRLRAGFYIYAMCTSSQFRGKGFASLILEEAYRFAQKSNALALILIPASEQLSKYYRSRGYEWYYKRAIFKNNTQATNLRPLRDEFIASISALQHRHIKTDLSVIWPKVHLDFALQEKISAGAVIAIDDNGYTIFNKEENSIIESMPLSDDRESKSYVAMIRFCEPFETNKRITPYFNWGLE